MVLAIARCLSMLKFFASGNIFLFMFSIIWTSRSFSWLEVVEGLEPDLCFSNLNIISFLFVFGDPKNLTEFCNFLMSNYMD